MRATRTKTATQTVQSFENVPVATRNAALSTVRFHGILESLPAPTKDISQTWHNHTVTNNKHTTCPSSRACLKNATSPRSAANTTSSRPNAGPPELFGRLNAPACLVLLSLLLLLLARDRSLLLTRFCELDLDFRAELLPLITAPSDREDLDVAATDGDAALLFLLPARKTFSNAEDAERSRRIASDSVCRSICARRPRITATPAKKNKKKNKKGKTLRDGMVLAHDLEPCQRISHTQRKCTTKTYLLELPRVSSTP